MLSHLHIENVAVIEKADLDLQRGLNVLTGETGAGKSILIDSINLALGERVSKDIVRSGSSKAHVSALFSDVSPEIRTLLEELGFECGDDGLLIQRDLSSDGKGTCRISGRPATVTLLRQVGRKLVNIHGQHDNQALLSADQHIFYLDRFARIEDLKERYGKAFEHMKKLEKELKGLVTDEQYKARRIDLLQYQIREIQSADLKPDEEQELLTRKSVIANSEKISKAVQDAHAFLSGGAELNRETELPQMGAQELLSLAGESLETVSEYYSDIKKLAQRITNLGYEIEDCAEELRSMTDGTEYDPNDLEWIEQRLDTIYRLKNKYGGSVEEILNYLAQAQKELDGIETSDIKAAELQKQLREARKTVRELAGKISEKRRQTAAVMEKNVKKELEFLDMPGVKFITDMKPQEPDSTGADHVEFLISANPGSPPRPLVKIASGGEISRVMLAIKKVLAGNDDIDTLIFDEIDTGVSGRAAQKIGMSLKQVSASRQVLCVTHLAQIAAQADRHILIEKKIKDGNTYTSLRLLDFDGRKRELARIIGGVEITELTLRNAEEMLQLAQNS